MTDFYDRNPSALLHHVSTLTASNAALQAKLEEVQARITIAQLIMDRASSWFDIQQVAHMGEPSAKARSIRDDMRRWLAPSSPPGEQR